jgi:hypothetical protein
MCDKGCSFDTQSVLCVALFIACRDALVGEGASGRISLKYKKQQSVDFKVLIQCYFSVNRINTLKLLIYIKI